MESMNIEDALAAAERSLESGGGLGGTGFWGAVSTVKRQPELIDRYADRIERIDSTAFERWALLVVPLHVGTALMVVGTAIGLVLISFAYSLDVFWAVVVFYLGAGALLLTTHGLGHLLVGSMVGIGFTSWFIGSIKRPQPGVKVDYSSYLRTPAKRRAWMHASGAIATKLTPFLLIGAAFYAGLPWWVIWSLVLIGAVTIVTDILWSTKSSDWRKFRREMSFAQPS